MISRLLLAAALASVLLLSGTAARAADVLVWSDEFGGTSINPANWEHQVGNGTAYGLPAGWGNNEQQYYTNRAVNSFVADGILHIVALQENFAGHSYTSARLRSLNLQQFLYGRMEARIKLPVGQGLWPAFWMLPDNSPYGGWAASGEIDIMESVNAMTTIHGTIHYGGQWPNNTSSGGTFSGATDYSDQFHVYAVEWSPDTLRWYIDGCQYYSVTSSTWFSSNEPPFNDRAPFDVAFHFLLNVAVGGNFPGNPNGTASFPQEMLIDWVRVYDQGTTQTGFIDLSHAIPGEIEAEDYDQGGQGVSFNDCNSSNNGGAYRPACGVDLEPCSEGGFNVGWLCAGEWIEYTVNVAEAGRYLVEARVASQASGGGFHLEFDGFDATGTINVPTTGGWQNWQTVTASADLSAGLAVMRFVNDAAGEFNLNHFAFTLLDPADLDHDGDVDLADYELQADCMAGPNVGVPPLGCTGDMFGAADLDSDGDVDLRDFELFAPAFNN